MIFKFDNNHYDCVHNDFEEKIYFQFYNLNKMHILFKKYQFSLYQNLTFKYIHIISDMEYCASKAVEDLP